LLAVAGLAQDQRGQALEKAGARGIVHRRRLGRAGAFMRGASF
jgi:hypothetical protein